MTTITKIANNEQNNEFANDNKNNELGIIFVIFISWYAS